MIPGVDTSGMGTYEIMNLIKAMLKDQITPQIMDRLKALIPEVTAPAMTLDEIMNTIQRRLTEGKALAGYVDQTVARLKAMTNPDVTGLDEGLTLVEAKIKDVDQIRAENTSLHRIMGRVKAKVNALLLDPREKIPDVCQILDAVDVEYAHVKERVVERENMISDAIGELRLILGVPKTEDLTLAQIVDLLKVRAGAEREHHTRLCGAVHMLTSTPADQVVSEIVRVIGSRDYYVKALLPRLCPDVDLTGKTVDEVLNLIEAQHKTVAERLGTSYAREMDLIRELAEVKTRLETAGRESADLARALHLAEDKINAQSVNTLSATYKDLDRVRDAIGLNGNASVDYTVQRIADTRRDALWAQGTVKMVKQVLGIDTECDRVSIERTLKALRNELTETRDGLADRVSELDAIKDALSLSPATPATEVVDKVKDLIKTRRKDEDRAVAMERRALIRFLDMPESTTWHEIANEVVRRFSYKDGVLVGIGDSIKTLATIVGLDPTVASLPTPGPIPSVINTVTAIRDSLLAVVGHPGGESLSLNAALSLLQSKVSGVALSLGLSEYASLTTIRTAIDLSAQYQIRTRLLTILCEDPNRAKTMTTDEVVNLIQSKIAALALNVSLPEHATWNMIMERIQHLAPSSLILHDLVSALGTTKAMDANEAMRRATDKIRYAQKQTSRLIKALGDGEAQDLHGAVDKILNMLTNMRPSLLLHKELASVLYLPEHASVNEAMRRATDKIKALRDLLNF